MANDNEVQQALRTLRDIGFLPDPDAGPPPEQPHYSSSEAKLLAKFEQFPSEITVLARMPPGNPAHLLAGKRFPKMLYKAQQSEWAGGKWATGAAIPRRAVGETDTDWQRRIEAVHRFAESCQLVVNDEVEYSRAHEAGWRDSAQEAMAFHEARANTESLGAAERAATDRHMSEKAQAEVAAAEAEHFGHLPEIPEKPRRRRSKA